MRKSELFAEILECVAFETEITKEQILSKDDARYMLVHFCHEKGMYITDIARMMRFSRRAVEKMISKTENGKANNENKGFEYRCLRLECEGVFRRHMLSYRLYNQVP